MANTQRDTNPFPYSDSDKRYHTYNYYMRRTYGEKCVRIALDIGCTCPNIDGSKGTGGCIYCSARGSGDFAPDGALPLAEQVALGRAALSGKWSAERIVPYFQAHTNTYAPISFLRAKFTEALAIPGAVGISIGTRADCLGADVLELLSELAEKTALTVELGLQSTSDETAKRINRCHTYAEFEAGYLALRAASDRIRIGVHLINGLPGEGREDMLRSARTVAALRPDEVKLHLLHVLRGTPLAELYGRGAYEPLTEEAYVSIVTEQLTLLPPETVIGRLTGDGAGDDLLAPLWSRDKKRVLNAIDRRMYTENLWQGKSFCG